MFTALGAASAPAGIPPGDSPSGADDGNRNHVYKLKPWKARFEYQMIRDARVYAELNSRSDKVAEVLKDQWWPIDCQLVATTQNGPILWNHIPNVGWIADKNIRTYSDARLEGSPTCPDPTGAHVWFEQPWDAAKEYRLKRDAKVRDRPGGEVNPLVSLSRGMWITIQCSARTRRNVWVRISSDGQGNEGWINADALKFWQQGLPAGLPSCTPAPEPRHWVAMGDSYASGQGAGGYSIPDDREGRDCRRSVNSYWYRLLGVLRNGLETDYPDFTACSGDTTQEVLDHQVGALNRETGLVTLSIGGNDLNFGDVMHDCAYPGKPVCRTAVDREITRASLAALGGRLDTVYSAIRAGAPKAKVIVLGYPQLVPFDHVDGCAALSDEDGPILWRATTRVNNTISAAVKRHKGFRFVGLVQTFRDHPACNDDAVDWINGIRDDRNESFHPDAAGHQAIAQRLREAAPKMFPG